MSNYGRRAFCFAGPYVWNSLPEHIRQSTSTAAFKRSLKTFLYSSRYRTERIRDNSILLLYGLYRCTDLLIITYCRRRRRGEPADEEKPTKTHATNPKYDISPGTAPVPPAPKPKPKPDENRYFGLSDADEPYAEIQDGVGVGVGDLGNADPDSYANILPDGTPVDGNPPPRRGYERLAQGYRQPATAQDGDHYEELQTGSKC